MNSPQWRWPREFGQILYKNDQQVKWEQKFQVSDCAFDLNIACGGTMNFDENSRARAVLDTGCAFPLVLSPKLSAKIRAVPTGETLNFQMANSEVETAHVVRVDIKIMGYSLINVPAAVHDLPGDIQMLVGLPISRFFDFYITNGSVTVMPNSDRLEELGLYTGKKYAV